METQSKRKYFFGAMLAAVLVGGASLAYLYRTPSPRRVAAVTEAWPERSRSAVKLMTELYGPPHSVNSETAIWRQRGPWKRITVRADSPAAPIEQTVGYRVPPSKFETLRDFRHGVRVDLDENEISAASADESRNRLALNLAAEIADGKREPQDARQFYAQMLRQEAAGKSSVYMTDLLFTPYEPAAEDRRRRGIGY